MNKKLFVGVAYLFICLSIFSTTNMVVKLKNGESQTYVTDNVEKVYIQKISNYVDLGLPSGTLWASCNLGSSRPEEIEDYYAWGETSTKDDYSAYSYKYDKKYAVDADGNIDSTAALLPENDAATVNLGADWRMPTIEEWEELKKNCKWRWTTLNGVYGSMFTAENGNWIFLPAAGVFMDKAVNQSSNGGECAYWSSSLHEDESAHVLLAHSNGDFVYSYRTYLGLPIRPVLVKKSTDSNILPQETITYMCLKMIGANQYQKIKVNKFDAEDVDQVVFEEKVFPEQKFVNLGLPSGTLWAAYNVGASAPEETGSFFAWGETQPKDEYYEFTTKYISQFDSRALKYSKSDSIATLQPEDDAATVNWGPEWRTPTMDDFRELVENCSWSMEEQNGVMGTKFTSDNGESIFIPASGYRYNKYNDNEGKTFCWSSSVLQENKFNNAYCFSAMSDSVTFDYNLRRYYGLPIRPVRVK